MLYYVGIGVTWLFVALCIVELFFLYGKGNKITAERILPEKFSLSDANPVMIDIKSHYPRKVDLELIDEVPEQFQLRNSAWTLALEADEQHQFKYQLTPYRRGEYWFGAVNIFVQSWFGFFRRRFRFSEDEMVKVYPSFLQLRKFRLAAISNRLQDLGIKKIRRIGETMEFEQIKDYVAGDDPRKVNWKATARRSKLMTNQYQDEKSQNVYCLIDKGRPMRMPFDQLSLLDYAINASLVLSHISIAKEDKAGLIAFSNKISAILPASKRSRQMHEILETLYNQRTLYKESNYELVFNMINRRIHQRSLLFLFTNFETLGSMRRQLKYLRAIAKSHLLVVVFFQNTELEELIKEKPEDIEGVYQQAIAEKISYEKLQIVNELRSYGIHALLTKPKNLTINAINKYLELKARGAI